MHLGGSVQKTTSLCYIMRDDRFNVIMAKNNQLNDMPILMAKSLAVRNNSNGYSEMYSTDHCPERFLVGSSFSRKVRVPKDTINLVDELKFH